jgi:electron-transferring-flavoprotein dehydrogenase
VETAVTNDSIYWLLEKAAIPLPVIGLQHNEGNYIISLSQLCRWLAKQAEDLGVEIYSGFPGAEVLYHEDGSVKGVATGDMGVGKDGKPTDAFTRGLELHAPVTLFAEGARGSLTKQLFKKFNLREGVDPQTFGLGIKEVRSFGFVV